jgi:ABC-type nitrate/sulfonate/bicarbonate transport system substrate-binding protein
MALTPSPKRILRPLIFIFLLPFGVIETTRTLFFRRRSQKMNRETAFLWLWVLWIAAIPAGGCSVQREPVSIALSLEPMSALAVIADTEGFLRKEGLDATIKEYASGRLALQGMLKGEAEFATVADSPIIVSRFERDDFMLLATIASSDNEPKIVARRDRGIARPADLAGKRIGTQKGSAVHFFLHHFLL